MCNILKLQITWGKKNEIGERNEEKVHFNKMTCINDA